MFDTYKNEQRKFISFATAYSKKGPRVTYYKVIFIDFKFHTKRH